MPEDLKAMSCCSVPSQPTHLHSSIALAPSASSIGLEPILAGMKRYAIALLLTLSLVVSAIPGASAVVTSGSKCSKAGTKQIYKNKIYTCIKLGKKLYWDNGTAFSTKPSASPTKFVCSESTAGTLNPSNKRERCVMVDDYGDNGQGGSKKIFGLTQDGLIPEWTLCRNDTQYWSNQTWYDGKWKCGYFVDGGSKWGWHTSASQFPSAIKQSYVVGNKTSQGTNTAPTKSCETNSSNVRASFGSDNSQGVNLASYIFENLSDCNLGITATITVSCPKAGLTPTQTTGSFPLRPKEKLAISGLNINYYFPQTQQLCYQLTGIQSNTVAIYGAAIPRVIVTSATP